VAPLVLPIQKGC